MPLKNDYAATGDPLTAAQVDTMATQVNSNTSDISTVGVLTPTIKTTTYTAAVSDIVVCDASAGAFTVTLPTTPADKSRIVVKKIDTVFANTVTVAAGGSSKFNSSIGPTTLSLRMQNHAVLLQYSSAGSGVWYEISSDVDPTTMLGNLKGTFASLPTASIAGRTYTCTDVGLVLLDNGSSWDRIWIGPASPSVTAPPSSSWTTVNLGSATFAADLDGRKLTAPSAAGTNLRIEYQTLSPTSNYNFTAYLEGNAHVAAGSLAWGICLLNNSNLVVTWGVYIDTTTGAQLYAATFNSATSFNANYSIVQIESAPNWFRLSDNGTNRLSQYSFNGVDWITFFSISRTDWITPTRCGWYGESSGTSVTYPIRLRSWLQA